MKDITNDQTYRQIGRYLSGECSPTQAEVVEAWSQGNPERESLLAGMRTLWQTRGQAPPYWNVYAGWQELEKLLEQARGSTDSPAVGLRLVTPADTKPSQADNIREAKSGEEDGSLQARPSSQGRRKMRIRKYRPYGFRFWLVRAAAALVLVGFVTLLVRELAGPPGTPSDSLALREVVTEPGQRVNLQLDDGTRVRMNAGSVLRMPGKFPGQARVVGLSGEAYFEVAADARPFIVVTDHGQRIEVLGTEFNVKSYRDEPFRVVVSAGVVSVRQTQRDPGVDAESVLQEPGEGFGQGIRLERGQMISGVDGSLQVADDVDLSRELSWLEHRLVFQDTPLRQVVRELERWYRVDVVLSDPAHGELRVTATFENEPLQEIFRSLSLSLNLDYDIEDGQVVFSRRP